MSPILKQCFVTFGVVLNMSQFALVKGFTTILLPQLQAPDSYICIDDTSGSWIAAIPGLSLLLGNFTVPTIMAIYGRKPAHIISNIAMIVGWVCIAMANSVLPIFLARLLQGVSLGMSTSLGPILIAEYASPKNRGVFLASVTLIMSLGTLIVHTTGSYITWQRTSTLCSIIGVVNLIIIVASPESPSWLVARGRIEDCRKAFHWLRGHDENDELNKMIASCRSRELTSNVSNSLYNNVKNKLTNFKNSLIDKEFYKPIFMMFHVYVLEEWAGINILSPYVQYVIEGMIGTENINAPLLIFSIDAQRVITTVVAIFMIKNFKRKIIILYMTVMCIIILLTSAGYSYARIAKALPFDCPFVGVILIHLHMFAVGVGSMTLPTIISGEIFPLKYRSLSSAISSVFLCFNMFTMLKSFIYLHKHLRLYGVYVLYAGVVTYSLVVIWIFLPETKDKTLQEIEEEFKGRSVRREDILSSQSLVRE